MMKRNLFVIFVSVVLFSCQKTELSASKNGSAAKSQIKQDTIFFIGDSIDKGYGLADPNQSHTTMFCSQVKAIEENHAVIGMTLQDGAPRAYGGSVLTRLSLIPPYNSSYNYLYIMLGTNDIEINSTSYTAAAFKSGYQTLLSNAVSKRWPFTHIVMVSPPYIGNYDYQKSYKSNPARALEYRDTVQSIATLNGIKYLDMNTITTNNGADSLLQADGLHYNIRGNQVMADNEASYFKLWGF